MTQREIVRELDLVIAALDTLAEDLEATAETVRDARSHRAAVNAWEALRILRANILGKTR